MILRNTLIVPKLTRFEIWLETGFGIAFKVCDIETVFWQFVDVGQKRP